MTDRFDIVVAGAGHNSLVAAAYLAKAGYKCLVLEGRSVLGGNVITEELTLPGFRHDSCGNTHVILQDSPMMIDDELGLMRDYGLDLSVLPFVLQYNKRDLPTAMPVATLEAELNPLQVPSHEAVAVAGDGGFDTLKRISKRVLQSLD